MSILYQWAHDFGIPLHALQNLQQRMGLLSLPPLPQLQGKDEAYIQTLLRLEASQKGVRLFRNNVGALKDVAGRLVRYGLANDSAKVNETIKSGDLIGIRPVVITPQHVGHILGQFVSREVKAPGWQFSGTPRELAQQNWANLINSLGGDACFANSSGTI